MQAATGTFSFFCKWKQQKWLCKVGIPNLTHSPGKAWENPRMMFSSRQSMISIVICHCLWRAFRFRRWPAQPLQWYCTIYSAYIIFDSSVFWFNDCFVAALNDYNLEEVIPVTTLYLKKTALSCRCKSFSLISMSFNNRFRVAETLRGQIYICSLTDINQVQIYQAVKYIKFTGF